MWLARCHPKETSYADSAALLVARRDKMPHSNGVNSDSYVEQGKSSEAKCAN